MAGQNMVYQFGIGGETVVTELPEICRDLGGPKTIASGSAVAMPRTDRQITESQLEAAARRYCKLAGINPESMIGHGPPPNANGMVNALLVYSPQWKLVAQEIRRHELMTLAIEAGRMASGH